MNLKKKKFIYDAALVFFVMLAAGSGGTIGYRILAKQKNDAALQSLSAGISDRTEHIQILTEGGGTAEIPPEGADGSDGAAGAETAKRQENAFTPKEALAMRAERLPGYRKLKDQNGDTAGWVSIPGTQVDYPVMQTPDNPDYYLKHNFDRQKSVYGVPYAAEDCDLEQSGGNTVIYGHHMKNGSMFAALSGYTDVGFYRTHPWFWFDTMEEAGLYRIIGICTASADPSDGDRLFELARIQDEEDYAAYVEEIKKRSFYDTGVTASWGEPLVTLMTCEYTTKEGRLFVVGKKYKGDGEE